MKFPKPMMILLMILIALLLFFGEGRAQNDNSWFIGNDGNDGNDGYTPSTAKQTLNGGILNLLNAGDTLYIMGGIWYEEEATSCIWVDTAAWEINGINGTSDNPIVITGNYPDSSMPLFDGDGQAFADSCVETSHCGVRGITFCNSSFIILDSVEIFDWCGAGIILRDCDNITIQNCKIHYNGSDYGGTTSGGITMGASPSNRADSCLIYNNQIYDNHGGHTNCAQVHMYGAKWNIIRRNEMWGNTANGAAVKFKVFQCDSNIVDSNLIHDQAVGIEICGESRGNEISYNVIWNTDFAFYNMGQAYGYPAYLQNKDNIIHNNTFFAGTSYNAGGVYFNHNYNGSRYAQAFSNTSWYNNISYYYQSSGSYAAPFSYSTTGANGDTNTFVIMDYNCYYGYTAEQDNIFSLDGNHVTLAEWVNELDYGGYDSNTIWDDPEFLNTTDPACDTFLRIRGTSPCATSGKDGSYMGAYAPLGGSPPDSLNTIALDSLINDHTGETDSVLVITATPNTFGDYVLVAISTTSYPVSSDIKSDSVVYQDNHTDTMRIEFTANEPCWLYVSGWVWSVDSGYSARLTNSIYFNPGPPTDTPDVLVSLDMDSSLNDYSGEFDSIQVLDSTGDETYPDSVIFTWSLLSCCPDSNSSNRRVHAYSNNTKTDSMYIVDDVIEPGWLYLSGWVMDTDSGWSPRTQDSIFFFRPIKLFLMRK